MEEQEEDVGAWRGGHAADSDSAPVAEALSESQSDEDVRDVRGGAWDAAQATPERSHEQSEDGDAGRGSEYAMRERRPRNAIPTGVGEGALAAPRGRARGAATRQRRLRRGAPPPRPQGQAAERRADSGGVPGLPGALRRRLERSLVQRGSSLQQLYVEPEGAAAVITELIQDREDRELAIAHFTGLSLTEGHMI